MLEGKEVDLKIGDVGNFTVDVDDKGNCALAVVVAKEVEGAKVSNELKAEVSIFTLAEKAAKASGKEWLVSSVEALENLLGIKKV